ncbi:MAG: 3-oxoadipate enol-lactonase [Acidimicrobiales bacterium]|jgi:3-oxoadipate enol-lactonase
MPGYGDAEAIEPLTYPTIARRLVDLLDMLGLETATLIGLSFGGMQALHTALEFPDRVSRLVIADSSPKFGIDGTTSEDWTRSRLEPIDSGGTPADSAELIIDAITEVRLAGAARAEIVESFGRISPRGFRAAVACLPTNDVIDRLGDIQQPTMVIVGELDKETPIHYSQLLVDGIPNSRLHVIPGVGHLTPAEAPREFNQLVAGFLSRKGKTPEAEGFLE